MCAYKIIGLAEQIPNKSEYKIQSKLSDTPEESINDEGTYLDNLPEPEGLLSKLPRNILIGLTHAGRNLHNFPHDLTKGAENIGKSFSQQINKSFKLPNEVQEKINSMPKNKKIKLSELLPYDTQSYADIFGQKGEGTLMDKVIQKGFEHSPELFGAASLIKSGLRKYPITQRGAARQLREGEKLINERRINNFQMNPELMKESIPFLPETRATAEMIQGVMGGEYSPAFALQSQIGKHARDLSKSSLASERLLAPKAQELKKIILHEMEQALRRTGHHKEAELLKGGIEDYAKYMKFREKGLPILKKLGFPTTGLAALGLGTKKGRGLAGKALENIIS